MRPVAEVLQEWTAEQDEAMRRLRQAMARGDLTAGAQEIAKWVDLDVLKRAYVEYAREDPEA